MKKIKYIKFLLAALLLGTTATSCMDGDSIDGDWSDPTVNPAPYGNNDIKEDPAKLITIKDLKAKTVNTLASTVANDTIRITEDWQLKARVVGNDVQGNIYNEIAVEDESGEAVLICISRGGLYSFLPVGQEILVNLKDLYIGIYGNNVQIGTPYTNTSGRTFPSRMSFNTWNEHFKIVDGENGYRPDFVSPEKFDVSKLKDEAYIKSHRGKLMTLENVELDKADGKLAWAPDADKDAGNGVSRTVKIDGKAQSLMVVRSSTYAKFAAKAMPTGKVNLTGIFTVYATNPSRYGYTWQILLRDIDDVDPVMTENNK